VASVGGKRPFDPNIIGYSLSSKKSKIDIKQKMHACQFPKKGRKLFKKGKDVGFL
jgi:hypothetical protein